MNTIEQLKNIDKIIKKNYHISKLNALSDYGKNALKDEPYVKAFTVFEYVHNHSSFSNFVIGLYCYVNVERVNNDEYDEGVVTIGFYLCDNYLQTYSGNYEFEKAKELYKHLRQSYMSKHVIKRRESNLKAYTHIDRFNSFIACLKHETKDNQLVSKVKDVLDIFLNGLSDYDYIDKELVLSKFGSIKAFAEKIDVSYATAQQFIKRKKISINLIEKVYPLIHD